MWIRTGIVSVVVCTLVALGLLFQAIRNPKSFFARLSQQRDPVYQWVESDLRSFDFMPGEGKAWGPVDPQQGEIRYSIRATMPVDIGLMDSKWADRMDAWGYMHTSATCFESKVRKSAKACKLTTAKPQLIFVRDLRPKQAGLGLAHEFGTRAAIQEPNSVIITILTRKCMENCKFALE